MLYAYRMRPQAAERCQWDYCPVFLLCVRNKCSTISFYFTRRLPNIIMYMLIVAPREQFTFLFLFFFLFFFFLSLCILCWRPLRKEKRTPTTSYLWGLLANREYNQRVSFDAKLNKSLCIQRLANNFSHWMTNQVHLTVVCIALLATNASVTGFYDRHLVYFTIRYYFQWSTSVAVQLQFPRRYTFHKSIGYESIFYLVNTLNDYTNNNNNNKKKREKPAICAKLPRKRWSITRDTTNYIYHLLMIWQAHQHPPCTSFSGDWPTVNGRHIYFQAEDIFGWNHRF